MPTLIVEDGSKVTDANSYIDLDYLESFAGDRGFELPADDTDKETLIVKAMDYIEGRSFQGSRTWSDQSLSWPRQHVYVDGVAVDSDVIPENLKRAVAQLVVEQYAGIPLYTSPRTSATEGFVTRETVGPITAEYSAMYGMASSSSPVTISSVELFLRPLIGTCNYKETIRL